MWSRESQAEAGGGDVWGKMREQSLQGHCCSILQTKELFTHSRNYTNTPRDRHTDTHTHICVSPPAIVKHLVQVTRLQESGMSGES